MDRSLDTGVGLKASAKKDEVSLPQTGPFFAGMKKAAEQQNTVDLMSARESAKKNKAVGSDGCPSEFWKYLSCVSMVVIFLFFLMRLLAMEDGRNVDSPHPPRGSAECRTYRDHRRRRPRPLHRRVLSLQAARLLRLHVDRRRMPRHADPPLWVPAPVDRFLR